MTNSPEIFDTVLSHIAQIAKIRHGEAINFGEIRASSDAADDALHQVSILRIFGAGQDYEAASRDDDRDIFR